MRNYNIRRKVKTKKQANKWSIFPIQIFFTFAILLIYSSSASAQEIKKAFNNTARNSIRNTEKSAVPDFKEVKRTTIEKFEALSATFEPNIGNEFEKTDSPFEVFKNEFIFPKRKNRAKEADNVDDADAATDQESSSLKKDKFHWKPALIQSGLFLGIQHSFRMTQGKTRRELGGPFFRDWANSVKMLRGWEDSDNFVTNDIMHPLQGGLTGRIFVNNSDNARRQEFGKSKEYWQSRFKVLIWSTVWSTQFELGPFSEATIGNVGLREKNGYSTMAYTDLVKTPILGTGVLIGEDAIDKYILKNWLEKKAGKANVKIKILRSTLTPTTTFANILRWRVPWKRDYRFN